jgi:hypothetical protein
MRIPQPPGFRGSLKWIQRLAERHPDCLDEQLRAAGALDAGRTVTWLSPLASDSYAEYRDGDFLNRIGHGNLASELTKFWPNRGPQWDGLAADGSKRVYLVEAKAHAAEMASTCQASTESRNTIVKACDGAKGLLGAPPSADWLTGYYQYANRLAHLGFLRSHGVDAWLVFLYFTGDADMGGPANKEEWKPHLDAAHRHLGLPSRPEAVVDVFLAVDRLN